MMTFNQLVKKFTVWLNYLPPDKNVSLKVTTRSSSGLCFGLRSLTSDTNVVYQESA